MVERYLVVSDKHSGFLGIVKALTVGSYGYGFRVAQKKILYTPNQETNKRLRYALQNTIFKKEKFITKKNREELIREIFRKIGRVA